MNELTEKILLLESKIKSIEIKDIEPAKIKDTDRRVKDPKKVIIENYISKVVKENKSKSKDQKVSVFKFGAEARKAAMETKESKKEEKIQKQLKCELCEYRQKYHLKETYQYKT